MLAGELYDPLHAAPVTAAPMLDAERSGRRFRRGKSLSSDSGYRRPKVRNRWWRGAASAPNNSSVSKPLDDKLRDLSAKYHSAYSAHKRFSMAIAEFAMAGERPPDLLQDSEKQAAAELAQVTDELRAAMAELAERAPANKEAEPRTLPAGSRSVVVPLKVRGTRR